MKNKIEDLRNHLFETIEMLKDKEQPLDIDRAKAISQVADTIIEAAKVEVKFVEVTRARSASDFFEPKKELPPARAATQLISSDTNDQVKSA